MRQRPSRPLSWNGGRGYRIGQLQVFEPDNGSLGQRLTTVEDFLIQHSSDLASIIQPATCPTAEEAAYLADLETDVTALTDAVNDVDTTDLTRPTVTSPALRNIVNRDPPPTLRSQGLHAEARRAAMFTAMLFVAPDQGNAKDETVRAVNLLLQLDVLYDLGLLEFAITQFCDTVTASDATPTRQPTRTAPVATPTPTATPTPAPTVGTQHPLVEEFGCQWIMDTYRSVAMAGRDLAILNLSTTMTAKRLEQGSLSFVGTGDAAAALRECEAQAA